MPVLYDILPLPTLFCLCFLLHVIADFNLQGILSDFKQRERWQKNYPDPKYSRDYRTAAVIHAFAWSILTFLPFCQSSWYIYAVTVNTIIHDIVDDMKANRHLITLSVDQAVHLLQIFGTAVLLSAHIF